MEKIEMSFEVRQMIEILYRSHMISRELYLYIIRYIIKEMDKEDQKCITE